MSPHSCLHAPCTAYTLVLLCAVLLSLALDQEVALLSLSPLPLPVLREAMCRQGTLHTNWMSPREADGTRGPAPAVASLCL